MGWLKGPPRDECLLLLTTPRKGVNGPPAAQEARLKAHEAYLRVADSLARSLADNLALQLSLRNALGDDGPAAEVAADPAPPAMQEQRASDAARAGAMQQQEQDAARKQAESPVAAPGKTAAEPTAATDQKSSASSAPTVSARTLFYGEPAARPDGRMTAQEKEQAMKPLAESAPQANRPERKLDQFAAAGRAAEAVTQLKPLGLRYSFVIRGADGQDREVDAATASRSGGHTRLTVEANQPTYLQIWKTVGSSTPQLLFPEKESGQISIRLAAGQRQQIPLPPEIGTAILTVRLSRVPFGPIIRQEAVMLDRLSPNQLQESIGGVPDSQEQATYVVNQDLSPSAQISTEISLSLP